MAASNTSEALPPELRQVRALVFDVIGTCMRTIAPGKLLLTYAPIGTNWHPAVATCIRAHQPSCIPTSSSGTVPAGDDWADRFAHHWRSEFFKYIADLAGRNEMATSSHVFTETLKNVMAMKEFSIPDDEGGWNEDVMKDLVRSWEAADGETTSLFNGAKVVERTL